MQRFGPKMELNVATLLLLVEAVVKKQVFSSYPKNKLLEARLSSLLRWSEKAVSNCFPTHMVPNSELILEYLIGDPCPT